MDAKLTSHTLEHSFQGEPRLHIRRDALRTNLRTLRKHLAANVKLCAVLKADAYGHGAVLVAGLIQQIETEEPFLRVDQFAVATFDEAAALAGFGKPIMILRPVENFFLGRQRELLETAIRGGWTLTLTSAAAADDVSRIAVHLQKRASVQIMLDTGMTRCGVSADNFENLLERVLQSASLRLTGVCTHFVNGQVHGDPVTSRQLRRFETTVARYPILEGVPLHAANSGAVFSHPRAHLDLVRPGIALYGIDPAGRPNVDRPLVPIMKWTAPVMALHDVAAGQGVGYGHTWLANAAGRVAILGVGYADGYPRSASNRGIIIVNNEPCGVVGHVSMDMLAVDVSRAGDVAVGDEVTLIDDNPLSPASIYTLSVVCGTISYEIACGIGARVKRFSPDAEQ